MVMRRASQRGVSYLALLLAVAITNGALATAATVWSHWQRRERETQLLWMGDQIRRAIVAYSLAGAERDTGFPHSLQDLLLDPRSAAPRRFLRQIYQDPMSRDTDWGLLRDPQGRLVGVYSRAAGTPAKRAGFAAPYAGFEGATRYADWRFTAGFTAGAQPQPLLRPQTLPAAGSAPAAHRTAPGTGGQTQGLAPAAMAPLAPPEQTAPETSTETEGEAVQVPAHADAEPDDPPTRP